MNIYCKNLVNKTLQLNLILLNETNSRFLSTKCTRYSLFNWPPNNSTVDVNNYRFNSIASQNRYLTKKSNRNNQTAKINNKKNPKESIKKGDIKFSPLFKPIEVKPNANIDEDDIGISMVGKLEKYKINEVLGEFRSNENVSALANEAGLNARMFNESIISFKKYCLQSKTLPVDLHIKLSDVIKKATPVTDLFPYFLKHTNEIYPHLTIMDDLKQISDLTEPINWYSDAREMKRKIIYHAGPTNSGKTYTALKSFQASECGIYCSPLKLLANEVFNKTNAIEAKCDLVTGEERKYANTDSTPANHMACTVEMTNLEKIYDVAVIDEIQMIKDQQRGWAWTRAFLGLKAKEIHLCGDQTAIDLISDLCFITQDELQIFNYERLTPLHIMSKALESFDKVEPGDCFVCFSKNDIFSVVQSLENKGHDVAVIYGSMPPGVKLAQAARFNDPNDKCKILVATDAVGMGLNLNIRRVIFYSIRKPQHKEKKSENDKESMIMEYITPSQALQIAGRAGRFNTAFKDGLVTCFNKSDLPQLLEILKQPLEKTEKAGLHPTADQIELFAYHLPEHSLSDLLKIFMSICKIDDGQYFLCKFEDIISLAEMIDHIPIKLRAKYTFATAPINLKQPFVCSCFVRFVRSFSNNEVITEEYLKRLLDWPFKIPKNLNEVTHLENIYDVLDLYLWLGHRFPDIFLYKEQVINMRIELESVISEGVTRLANIYKSSSQLNNKYTKNHQLKNLSNRLSSKKNIIKDYTQSNKHETSKKNYGSLTSYLKKAENMQEKKQQIRPLVNNFKNRKSQIADVIIEQIKTNKSTKTSSNDSSDYENLLNYLKTPNSQKIFETNNINGVDINNNSLGNKETIKQSESEKLTSTLNESSNVQIQETNKEQIDNEKSFKNKKPSIIELLKSGSILNSIKQVINSTYSDNSIKKDSADQNNSKK